MARQRRIQSLYYITHVENIPSILHRGILSHQLIEEYELQFARIYDEGIVSHRKDKRAPDGRSLWEFANLFFQPRNPMLYRVLHETDKSKIAIVAVRPQVLDVPGVYVSTGNAAHSLSQLLPAKEGLRIITGEMWDVIQSEWWREEDGSKRQIMAECLVPGQVDPSYIQTIYVADRSTAESMGTKVSEILVVPEPPMFFQPRRRTPVTRTLTLVDGDMFFSNMQTLTISVNTVGVMGKGLASRTKYQFPDVYVFYQDLCRRKILVMGKPYLYKREGSVEMQLAADPLSLDVNDTKWFLLFPTKRHWRENSDIQGIEEGLQWIRTQYKMQGIQSLALPALGCGLGQLDWKDVGHLMTSYLSDLDIPVAVYLPQEAEIPAEFRSASFLLSRGRARE